MSKADNRLSGAGNLGALSTSPLSRSNSVGLSDLDDLHRFTLSQHSSLDLSLSNIKKGTNIDLELYALKRPFGDIVRQVGKLDFRKLRGKNRSANVQLITSSKQGGNQNERIALDSLEAGEYFVRVLQRKGNSRYLLQAASTPTVVPPSLSSGDTIAPTATLNAASSPTTGSSTYDFTVTYRDNAGINISSINGSDILVTNGSGYSQLATFVSVDSPSNGTPRTATYRITAPGGSWDSADNGTYNVTLQGNQVADTSGNVAAAKLIGNFQVSIGQPPPEIIDTIAPTATLSAASSPIANNSTYDFTVTYSDNAGINVSSIDNSDILVTNGSGYSQVASLVPGDNTNSGTPRTATYRITAPGGTWDSADNGSYSVTLQPNQVSDTSGNFVANAPLGSFQVNIPRPVLRYSGSVNGNFSVAFTLNAAVPDADSSSGSGFFRDALTVAITSGSPYSSTNYGGGNVGSYIESSQLVYQVDLGSLYIEGNDEIYNEGGDQRVIDNHFIAEDLFVRFSRDFGSSGSLTNTLELLQKALVTGEIPSSQFTITLSGYEEQSESINGIFSGRSSRQRNISVDPS